MHQEMGGGEVANKTPYHSTDDGLSRDNLTSNVVGYLLSHSRFLSGKTPGSRLSSPSQIRQNNINIKSRSVEKLKRICTAH
jgi:hypothetical protein